MNKQQYNWFFFIKILISICIVVSFNNNFMTVDQLKMNINRIIDIQLGLRFYNKQLALLEDHFFKPGIKYRFLNTILNNKQSYEANDNPKDALMELVNNFSSRILETLEKKEKIHELSEIIDEFFNKNSILKDSIKIDYNAVLQESEFLRKELALFVFNKEFNWVVETIAKEEIKSVHFDEVNIIWNILFEKPIDIVILTDIKNTLLPVKNKNNFEQFYLLQDILSEEEVKNKAKSEIQKASNEIKQDDKLLFENIKKNIDAYYQDYIDYIKTINYPLKNIELSTDLKTIMETLQKYYHNLKQYEFLNSVFLMYEKRLVTNGIVTTQLLTENFITKANKITEAAYEEYNDNLLKSSLEKISLTIGMINELNYHKENNLDNFQGIKPLQLIHNFQNLKKKTPIDTNKIFDINNETFSSAKKDYVKMLKFYDSIEDTELNLLIDFFKTDDFRGKKISEYNNLNSIDTIITKINIQWFTKEFETIKKNLEENELKFFADAQKAKDAALLAEAQRLQQEKQPLAEAQRLQKEEAERKKQNLKDMPQELPKTSEESMKKASQEKPPKKFNNNKKKKKSDLEKESMENSNAVVWVLMLSLATGLFAIAANEIKKQMRKRDKKQKNKQDNKNNKRFLNYEDKDMDDQKYQETENQNEYTNNQHQPNQNEYTNNQYQPNQNEYTKNQHQPKQNKYTNNQHQPNQNEYTNNQHQPKQNLIPVQQ